MINKFHATTNETVKHLLISLNASKQRVRLVLGDVATGKSWNEENDTIGTVGCSTGTQKIPLLIRSARSLGGGSILDHCIIGILAVERNCGKRRWLYKAPNYIPSIIEAKGLTVIINGEIFANCGTEEKANNLTAFMRLERNKQ